MQVNEGSMPLGMEGKGRSLTLLLIGQVAGMSLWFITAAVLPDLIEEAKLSSFRQAALSSGVQAGFVIGALISAFLGLADRFDPRRVFAISAISAGLINASLLMIDVGGDLAIIVRVATGALLAGVYPVGMKIAVGWGLKDRGFLVGALVGALTLGSAAPHLMSYAGGTDWRLTIGIASVAAIVGGLLCLASSLGPYHGQAVKFDPRVVSQAWTNRRVRLAYAGYLGHMWELYAMWAWIGVAATVSYRASLPEMEAQEFAKLTAFTAIAAGGFASVLGGLVADKVGKAEVAIVAMAVSGTCAVLTGLTFGGPVWLTFVIVFVWGLSIAPDSAQFSALIADASPPEQAGSLMTFQTALGFTLTFVTVQLTPLAVGAFGWPVVLATLAIGPAFGIVAMLRLRAMT
jgi:MFS family permease